MFEVNVKVPTRVLVQDGTIPNMKNISSLKTANFSKTLHKLSKKAY